jgi:hypothetical protein
VRVDTTHREKRDAVILPTAVMWMTQAYRRGATK